MPSRSWSFVVFLTLLGACGSCDGTEEEDVAEAPHLQLPVPDVRIVAITDLQGTLAPCGCTSRPLGGIDRMVHFVQAAGATLFISAGDVLAGGPHHGGPESAETNRWKSETAAAILSAEDLRAAGGPADAECGVDLPGALLFGAEANDVTVEVANTKIGLVALHDEGELGDLARRAQELRNDGATIIVVLAAGTRRMHRDAASTGGVDFVLQGGLNLEEPSAPSDADGWLLHAGRQGQRILTLDLYLRGEGPFVNVSEWNVDVAGARLDSEIEDLRSRLAAWSVEGRSDAELRPQHARLAALQADRDALQVPALPADGRAFSATITELDPDMPRSESVQAQLAALDLRINEHNQGAYADRLPPPPPEDGARYVGSAACGSCHAEAFEWWQGHPHGRAYATLEGVNKQFHLDCVGCHVTGYERPGGSTVTHNLEGALTNVGCENCHGAGSQHIEDPAAHPLQGDTEESTCTGCHNEEHSDLFNYDVYRRTLLVPGHGLPPTP